jgi:acyl-CoA dehydrogenase|nr:acyl-CoA dehydrogenase family protein [Kofleriaceae bacterium]
MKLSSDDLGMFFEPRHRELAERLRAAAAGFEAAEAHADEAARDRAAVAHLAASGLFEIVVPADGRVDSRSLCLAREMLGYCSARADSILAVQGLGSHPLLVAGSPGQRAQLPALARGASVAAFALTEPEAGSDVAAIATRATPCADGWRLDGDKLFISNLGIADHAVVFARQGPAGGADGRSTEPTLGGAGLTAFWVPLATPGVTVVPMTAIAPHPIGGLQLRGAIVPADARVGEPGHGMRLAMQTLDTFRVSVGAAAVGMARRALDEAIAFVSTRVQFGKTLGEQPLVQAHLADMVVDLDAARLLVLRAAHRKDTSDGRVTTEVSIAKLGATEAAQRVIDRAVQLLGGRGVMAGHVVEHLYRAIRPLRIYEGTSEIQRTIIGRALVGARRDKPKSP